mgnify:CR=1 FL=1
MICGVLKPTQNQNFRIIEESLGNPEPSEHPAGKCLDFIFLSVAKVTGSVNGKVWEYLAKPDEAVRLNDAFAVSNLKNEGEMVVMEFII